MTLPLLIPFLQKNINILKTFSSAIQESGLRRSWTVAVAVTFFRYNYLLIALGNLQSC